MQDFLNHSEAQGGLQSARLNFRLAATSEHKEGKAHPTPPAPWVKG